MEREKHLGDLVNTLSKECFGMSLGEAHEKKICIQCKKKMDEFENERDRMEYEISGLCSSCYDKTFE